MITLSSQQEDAVRTVVTRLKGVLTPEPLTYVAGYAGTGKSTILPFILESLGYPPEQVAFVAPTGKAAKVMRAKLKAQGYPNCSASTIHSAIYRAKPAPVSALEAALAAHQERLAEINQGLFEEFMAGGAEHDAAVVLVNRHPEVLKQSKLVDRCRAELYAAYDEDKINFQLNPDAPIQLAQLIVVDEASMVGSTMASDLMEFGVPILALGDPGQLPPIEDEGGLTANTPDYFLSEIHRQAADNPIIRLSMLAREGEDLPYGDYGDGVSVMNRRDYDYTGSFDDRPIFIVGMNKTRWKITQMLRTDFGFIDDPRAKIGPRMDEPLMVTKNVKDHPNLVNGTECIALTDMEIEEGSATATISFEDDEGVPYHDKRVFQGQFEEHFYRKAKAYSAPKPIAYKALKSSIVMDFSYVITAHKSQGSQWADAVVIDESHVFRDEANRWLYTAVTRAEERLTVLR